MAAVSICDLMFSLIDICKNVMRFFLAYHYHSKCKWKFQTMNASADMFPSYSYLKCVRLWLCFYKSLYKYHCFQYSINFHFSFFREVIKRSTVQIDTIMSYCRYCLNDTGLTEILPFLKVTSTTFVLWLEYLFHFITFPCQYL